MKTLVRTLTILIVSIALGFAAYAVVQPINPSVSFSQSANPSIGAGHGVPQGEGAGTRAGHPQASLGSGIAMLATVLGKFLAAFIGVAALRALVGKIASGKGTGKTKATATATANTNTNTNTNTGL